MQTTGPKCHKLLKNVNVLEFHDHIWNNQEKYIQIGTNMPSIGLVICEICKLRLRFLENKQVFYRVKLMAA